MLGRLFALAKSRKARAELTRLGIDCDSKSALHLKSLRNAVWGKGIHVRSSRIKIDDDSSLTIGDGCQIINSQVSISNRSQLVLESNVRVVDATICLRDCSQVKVSKDSLVRSERPYYEAAIDCCEGIIVLQTNSNIKGKLTVKHGRFVMGKNSFLNYGSEVRCYKKIDIGDFVFISYFVDIFDTNTHSLDWRVREREAIDGYPNNTIQTVEPVTEPIRIGNNVWIGKYAAILKGCVIGDRSVIGTRTVATESFPPDSLICGNPAVMVRTLAQEMEIN